MAKIPFTLEAWLKDKSQKVIDNNGNELVICSFEFTLNEPYIHAYEKKNGCGRKGYKLDEVFFCPEPELSAFEKAIKDLVLAIDEGELQELGVFEEENLGAWAIKQARELLALAEREIINRVAKECYKEDFCIEDTVKFNEGYKLGKEVTLKDLPRWKKASGKERFSERMIVLAGDNDLYCTNYAEEGEYYLPFSILEKLPKEDEDHE